MNDEFSEEEEEEEEGGKVNDKCEIKFIHNSFWMNSFY